MSDEPSVSVEIGRGSPTPEELAAIVAVVTEVYARERAVQTAPDAHRGNDAWMRSARGLRQPWDPRAGRSSLRG